MSGTIAERVEMLLESGARPEIVVAATHGLLLEGARDTLSHAAVREVFVADPATLAGEDWPHVRVVSVAPVISAALRRLLADGSTGDLS